MNDLDEREFDARLKRLVNENVDAGLGARRRPPQFSPESKPMPVRRTWVLPLTTAASVAIIVGATFGVVRLSSHDHTVVRPGTHHSAPNRPTPSQPTPRPDPTPDPTVHASDYHTVTLGQASIAVPKGWVTHRLGASPNADSWCLYPSTVAAPPDFSTCPVVVSQIAIGGDGQPAIDVDNQTGFYGDPPQFCAPNQPTSDRVDSGVRNFGGRSADYRYWHIDCPTGKDFRIEQYVVPTDRSYIAYALQADATAELGLRTVTAHSVLPQQDRPVRLMDHGIIRSASVVAGGTKITLDRVVRANGANPDPATFSYVIPSSVRPRSDLHVGTTLTLFTDGQHVLQAY